MCVAVVELVARQMVARLKHRQRRALKGHHATSEDSIAISSHRSPLTGYSCPAPELARGRHRPYLAVEPADFCVNQPLRQCDDLRGS